MASKALEVRAFLMHISHYDPSWTPVKDQEKPFDLETGLEIVASMAKSGMNLLIVDCADGVVYKSHPELRRHYSAPMSHLQALAKAAHEAGIDVAPKLNFSKSGRNHHDMWLKPHWDWRSWLANMDDYYAVARDVIGELVAACRSRRFFHIGMDEDHYRSVPQYVQTIKTLRGMIRKHGLRTVIWNDSCHDQITSIAQVHAEKCRAAESLLPKDIVEVLWDYGKAHAPIVKRIASQGFEVWGAPGVTLDQVKKWRAAVKANGGKGLLMTRWRKCDKAHRKELLDLVNALGPEYSK